jgi:predicted nucleotidyltransferase
VIFAPSSGSPNGGPGAPFDETGLVPHIWRAVSLPDEVTLARLRSALEASALVRLAVLFGSRATGTARSASDFDVGILPWDSGLALQSELALAAALSGVVGQEVDLVRLDGDNPLLGREVARTGFCLFEAEPGLFAAYRASAVACWLDFDEVSTPHRRNFLRRLAGA